MLQLCLTKCVTLALDDVHPEQVDASMQFMQPTGFCSFVCGHEKMISARYQCSTLLSLLKALRLKSGCG